MGKKLIVPIFILALLLSGCAKVAPTVINHNSASSKAPILGSSKYVQKIQNIAKKSGNRSALDLIMIDVDKNGKQLDNIGSNNISRFHKLISSLIYKIGYVDMKTHYFRNQLNRAPKTLKELIHLNRTLPMNRRWILLGIRNSGYHIQGVDGEYNLKFVSYDDFCEAVYNKKGMLLDENNDSINMGTYNYAAGIPNIKAHFKFDMYPYFIWGNTLNSPQKGRYDIDNAVNLAYGNYKKHAASVYLYRKNLFGMQQGRVK